MNEIMIIDNKRIENMIYEIRGMRVMLDSDIATLFNYETKQINRQVARNVERFPEKYCFQLTEKEYNFLRCQIGTLETKGRGEHRKYLPFVFTEYGVTMLAGILKSDFAVKMSLKIVDAFISMKNYLSNNFLEQNFYKNMLLEHDSDIKLLKETFSKFDSISNEIFYDGQIYDAYSLLLDIFNSAKKRIVIIDNYASKELLDVLSSTKKDIIIYSKNINDELIKKYKGQYNNVTFKYSDKWHDRFIIVDEKVVYHCGASFKDLGKKCFAINKIIDKDIVNGLLSRLNIDNINEKNVRL